MSLPQSQHPYHQQAFKPVPASVEPPLSQKRQVSSGTQLESALNSTRQLLQNRVQHNPSISTDSSGKTFYSAQTIVRQDTSDQSVLENNTVDSYPSSKAFHKPQTIPYNKHEPQAQSFTNGNESGFHELSRPKQASQIAQLRSASASPRVPDTPLGARSFSSPIALNDIKSNESLRESVSQTSSRDFSKRHDRQSKSLDLSHLYLLDRDESTYFTLTNESLSDVSHTLIKQYLGENFSSSLLPRMKTIEMYRKNVKKSNDPKVLFQYAQYMLQTALAIDTTKPTNTTTTDNTSNERGAENLVSVKKQFLKEAVYYLKKLSDKGYTDAQYLLADAHGSGALGKVDNKEAFSLFQGAAKHGHIESAYRTAYCYEEGLGVSRDSRRAIDFLKFAASKNHPAAMFKLGIYSFYGKMGLSDNVNTKKAGIQWLSRASNKANELINAAPYELAKIQQNGFLDIVIPDLKYAMELYVQAASLGHVKSATILGKAYELGNSVVEPDADLSIHYYTQGAVGGDTEAMLALCAWYLIGNPPNLPKDNNEAFQWAYRAASLNFSKAQFAVGNFFEKGIGCDANLGSAKEWYEKAAQNGDVKASSKLRKMNDKSVETKTFSGSKNNTNNNKKNDKKEKNKKKDKDCIII